MKKLLVIIATGDKEKALAGLMYARNAWAASWFEDVKLVFFGPSESLILDDKEVGEEVNRMLVMGKPYACKSISEKQGISKDLDEKGLTIVGVGPVMSKLINNGYIPMVW